MSGTLSGARGARSSALHRLFSRASARDLHAFVVPGPEVARARGLNLGAAGLRVASTPRHANVLLVVGGLPEGLRRAAAVAYAQMPRPRAVLAAGTKDVTPLPGPDVSVDLEQEALRSGVAELRRRFVASAFGPEVEDFEAAAIRSKTEYTCSMHPEVARDEPGTCPECGTELVPREAADDAEEEDADGDQEGHAHDGDPDGTEEEDQEGAGQHETERQDTGDEESGGGDQEDEGGDHDHDGPVPDEDFMSMVAMTQGTPRSSDGLQMEWVETPFGPLFPGLPGGLSLTFTLDGDTVAEAGAGSAVDGRVDPVGPVGAFVERLAGLDPLSPVSYRLLALRAVENAVGVEVQDDVALGRMGALERERAAGHLNWLAGFGYLLGYAWLTRQAEKVQFEILRADPGEITRLRKEVQRLARRVERTPLLRRRLAGIGEVADLAVACGPVARAGGREVDVRTEEEVYQSVGFEPVVEEGGDALARLRVRLAEAERSLGLAGRVGGTSAPDATIRDGVSGSGTAVVETPRGTATLKVSLEDGGVTGAGLETPSAKHVQLVAAVTEEREVADALVGIASLDLSPWSMARAGAG